MLQRQPPPDVEWWDAPLLSNKSYTDLDDPSNLKINTDDSLITLYVQHPIPIPAPWENRGESARPLMLTKKVSGVGMLGGLSFGFCADFFWLLCSSFPPPPPTLQEQKKMRRQRRAADLRDKQDRQKMGLIPPDPPKGEFWNVHPLTSRFASNSYPLISATQFVSPIS